jgi:uncharacterized protein YkwD
MRKGALLALPFLAACMGSLTPEVMSDGSDSPRPGIIGTPPEDGFLGHVSFDLLLNDTRGLRGVSEVSENAALNRAASDHARDMVRHNYLSHTGRNGSTPGDRAAAAGYDWDYISENIARGFTTEEGVMNGWMASPSHRDNILDPRAEDFGLGRVDNTWVLMLGSQM